MTKNRISVTCRAKVNLTLDVLDRRPDGYHNLASVMQSIDLADILHIELVNHPGIEITSNQSDIPTGPDNTVHKACSLLLNAVGSDNGVQITLEKHIPHQAGLGGGSSDAAGMLVGLNYLLGNPLPKDELYKLAAQIGSDVPYFLIGGTALVKGRGEVVEKLPDAPKLDLVIVKPDVGIPTAWAYNRLAELSRKRTASTSAMVEAIHTKDRKSVVDHLFNDFELVAVEEFPAIKTAKQDLADLGAEATLLCGSGSAVFGVFSSSTVTYRAAEQLAGRYPFVVPTITTTSAIMFSGV